ncbi:hypothetical protein [Nocardia sp. CDC160]|uniref:hypothetical protein n=1 Tax=Nocardia sp. CDC160 TaxID=3112166 RepID=UPI002DBE2E31|nr:hypothetical protein [Nocardia sp. CDC160]MEC3913311.1 hypothetical protein [Nocardia sp. CDC160]
MSKPQDGARDEEFFKEFMSSFVQASGDSAPEFEVVSHPGPGAVVDEKQITEQARELTHRVARELAADGPEGWERIDAVFAWTVAAQAWNVTYSANGRGVRAEPSQATLLAVQEQREIAAQLPAGPWWRMRLIITNAGQIQTDYDYGDEPFPDDQLFPAEAYRADLQQYPRDRLPVWLAAYVGNEGRQQRSPRVAAEQARIDRGKGIRGEVSTTDFPPLQLTWARWTAMAAAFAAIGSAQGPRILPALAWFEGSQRSGSTLYVLPGDRAVISGGVWNAPALDAAYNEGKPLPELYAGAPDWITDAILNPRAVSGLLSFCYWWENGNWYRGESPAGQGLAEAVPGVWTAEATVDIIVDVLAGATEQPVSDLTRTAVATLVAAAEAGVVTFETISAAFDPTRFDVDAALNQFSLAGLRTFVVLPPLSRIDAIEQVRRHIRNSGADTTGYHLDQLTADRIDAGWMVYVPTQPGEIMLGRAIYYIADDGVIEASSSSVPPNVYIAGFTQRYRDRSSQ